MGGQGVFVFLFGLGRQHCLIFSECWSKNTGGFSPAPSKRLCFMQNQHFILVTGQGCQGQNCLQGLTASLAPKSKGECLLPCLPPALSARCPPGPTITLCFPSSLPPLSPLCCRAHHTPTDWRDHLFGQIVFLSKTYIKSSFQAETREGHLMRNTTSL